MKPIILHLSNDYPDPLLPNKTKAVINLVEGTPQYRHVVYTLNRVSAPGGLVAIPFGDDRTALAYGALPKGIMWEWRLPQIARWIANDIKAKGIKPDLIEAHKFTIEGVIGLILAKEFSCPLICDIQGGTDLRLLRIKKGLRKVYQEIAKASAAVFPYSPWPLPEFEEIAGLAPSKCHMLPVIPHIDTMSAAPFIAEEKLATVFHLDGWKNKNFEGMVLAVKELIKQGKHITLDVYGAGKPETILKLHNFIMKQDLKKHVFLKGAVENGRMPEILQRYAGFVMPSHNETYGLVYVESLFSGVPIILNKKAGISGYLDITQIGYECSSMDVQDIAKGMAYVLDNQKTLKENIAQMQKRGVFDFMRKHSILKTYAQVIDNVLKAKG